MPGQNIPIVSTSNLYMQGLSYAYTDAFTVTISPGQCRDSNNVMDIVLSTPLIVKVNVIGIGGIDTGSIISNHCYAICVIADSSGNNVPSTLIFNQLSQSQPILPPNYDSWRLVGYISTNGASQIIPFTMFGNSLNRYFKFSLVQPINASGAITGTFQLFSVPQFFPNVNYQLVDLNVIFTPHTAGDAGILNTFSSNTYHYSTYGIVASVPIESIVTILISNNANQDGTTNIGFWARANLVTDNFVINAAGYRFDV